jgi:hypothetical protein
MKTIRVAAVQFQHAPGDKLKNLETIRRFVEQAAAREVEIIAFPECCIYGMTIGAGLIEAGPGGALYNTYVVAMPDGRFARHRKLHAFVSRYLSSGDEFTVFDTPHGWRGRRADLLRQQHRRERPRHRLGRRRDPARAAPNRRLRFGQPARDERHRPRRVGQPPGDPAALEADCAATRAAAG